ncbi:glycoside hydrolase family 71 protein [Epithele typhae]|uniref:glycoside hydrolase family 71 protein n=1 Tax=Epithele typhae TaxID=378194 RepID=UPI002007B9C2|nr:glycoside hydrolase family 71 protein [Epithele typhae]KAH9935091.1 glycoside hydrolase family 71 protein [Epithele typhae]
MVGNTHPYTVDDWIENISLAYRHEIDAFALNVGPEGWQKQSVDNCFQAARLSGLPFKLFLSFDMNAIPGQVEDDVLLLRSYFEAFARHSHQLRYNGKPVVSTFAGQQCLFGCADLDAAWTHVKRTLEDVAPIHFIPSFFIDPRRYPHIHSMDGYFNWNGGWPIHLTPDSPRRDVELPELDTDRHHIHHLGGRTFMAAVSPWFFTHYGENSWNKNWIYRGDDWLYVRRWEQLVAARDTVDIVQIVSWNDFGESHYIGPIKGAQPKSESWVDGFPHTAWLHLTRSFARAFKTGTYPTVERDEIYMWARPHLKHADATHDEAGRPEKWQLTDDKFWVVVLATAPAEVRLATSDLEGEAAAERSYPVREGLTKLSHPLVARESMKATMIRDGRVVAECAPERAGFRVQARPRTYNFNAFVATSIPSI